MVMFVLGKHYISSGKDAEKEEFNKLEQNHPELPLRDSSTLITESHRSADYPQTCCECDVSKKVTKNATFHNVLNGILFSVYTTVQNSFKYLIPCTPQGSLGAFFK